MSGLKPTGFVFQDSLGDDIHIHCDLDDNSRIRIADGNSEILIQQEDIDRVIAALTALKEPQ